MPRLPRFKRVYPVTPIQLTERDCDILRLVHRHRFLHSQQIVALMGGSRQQVVRRLQVLFHHGYLERPRAQIQYYERGGSRTIAYGLGNKGGVLLRQQLGITVDAASWSEKNHLVGRIFLEHALAALRRPAWAAIVPVAGEDAQWHEARCCPRPRVCLGIHGSE